ncbi:hypothetical protein FB45DRAFT_697418, partial [Roridomyces roridus]
TKPSAKPGPKLTKNAPRTTARFASDDKRQDLTYHDWIQVFDYMDDHKSLSPKQVVAYFNLRPDKAGGKLQFGQSALSKKLKQKDHIRATVATGEPNVLSMKRARVVTSPEVDKALGLWVQDMERKRHTVTGPMLIEQRKRFEVALDIPEEQRLTGGG